MKRRKKEGRENSQKKDGREWKDRVERKRKNEGGEEGEGEVVVFTWRIKVEGLVREMSLLNKEGEVARLEVE